MPETSMPNVPVHAIRSLVGNSAFDRGQAYAEQGRVLETEWDPSTRTLSGLVAGSQQNRYRSEIELERQGPTWRPGGNYCSCFLGGWCKHVAALLLVASTDTIVRATRPEWRSVLEGIVAAGTPQSASSTTPLGLEFEVRERASRGQGRWMRAPNSTVKASASSTGELQVMLRIVSPGKRDRWVGTGLTWGQLSYGTSRYSFDPRQLRWFREFIALAYATGDRFLPSDSMRFNLSDFSSPALWRMLHEADELGIPLVNAAGEGVVRVGSRASITLRAARDERGVRLSPTVDVDGTSIGPASVRPVADHGIVVIEWLPQPTITLAPTASALTMAQTRVLRASLPVIPPEDVDDFLATSYPSLARAIAIESTDASFVPPKIEPPVLVLTARFRENDWMRCDWSWEYRVGQRTSRLPFGGTQEREMDVLRDPENEERIAHVVRGMLRSHGAENALPDPVVDAAVPTKAAARTRASAQPSVELRGTDAADFSTRVLPALEEHPDVRVEVVGDRPAYRELLDAPILKVSTVETDQRDWFDLGVLVTVEGRQVPFAPLFSALSRNAKKLLLIDKSYLSLDQPVFDRLRELIAEAGELAEWETGPRISRYQASLWSDFEDLADESAPAQAWRDTVGGLMTFGDAEAVVSQTPLPRDLNATLRPYQRTGYDWLTFLYRHGLGGILADDMGLGKTLQTLALVAHAVQCGTAAAPFLVVAPSSVVSNWVSEAKRFTPGLRVASMTRTSAKSSVPLLELAANADVVVMSYALFRLDYVHIARLPWAGLILDEAQFVKNRTSKAYECARDLDVPFTLAITGTPLENNLMELWALLSLVAPGLFPSATKFDERYIKPIAHGGSGGRGTDGALAESLLARLRRRIRPLLLRRTKELVAPELPAKQEQVLQVALTPRHRRLYDLYLQRERQKLLNLVEDLDRNRFTIFRSLTLLRMLALDPALIDDAHAGVGSAKIDALLEQLDDVLAEGHQALVFSQFTSYLDRVAARMDSQGIRYAMLTGSTTNRSEVIASFKRHEASVFLISLKAGGFGLNLTEADYVFLLDPWWNPASEEQAIDRSHRIGQTESVMVYRLVAQDTIEDKVMALKAGKAKLFDAVLDEGDAFTGGLTAADIRGLLQDAS